jgi:RND family efflux transporter MFP subunit
MSATNASSAAVSIDLPGVSASPGEETPDIRTPTAAAATDKPRAEPRTPSTPVDHWLNWQCRMVSGVYCGAVFLVRNAGYGGFRPTAVWPDQDFDSSVLRRVAEQAISSGTRVTQKDSANDLPGAEVADFVAYPLFKGEEVVGAVSLSLAIRSESQRHAVLQLLQWGMVWLENAVNNETAERSAASVAALEAVSLVSRDLPLAVVCHELCNFLAERLDCSHVALGTWVGLQVRVLSISHQLQFDRRVSQIGQLEFAMEECLDQGDRIVLPARPGEDKLPTQAHEQLLRMDGNGSVCSLPLKANGESVGALLLIRDRNNGFDKITVDLIAGIADCVGPLIHLKQREARSGWGRSAQTMGAWLGRLFGAGQLRLKVMAAACVLILGMLTLIQTDHRVSAVSSVEGAMQQAVVAPFAGYLSSANARAGDEVDEGQVLAVLDDRDLLLEHEKWSSERDKHNKEYQQALAVRDRAKVSMMSARIAQADAQLRLVDEQLGRTKLRAPFAGVLVSGDLSRALGAPVERGQLLFEIVPSEGYHVSLEVDEHDVAALEAGQKASLRLTGMPDETIPLRISRIFPVASADAGSNHFRVEGELESAPEGLRPGMQGVAKVVVGRASLLTVWTSSLLDRLRLWVWSLGI